VAATKVSRLAAHQQADGMAVSPYELRFTARAADKDAAYKVYFPVDAGQQLLALIARCITTVNGVTPAVVFGDKDDDDGYIAAAAVIETAGNVVNSLAAGAALAGGKYYAATNYIAVKFNSDATAGEYEVTLLFSGRQ